MLISSRYHRLLSNDVKRNSEIDGMCPFKLTYIHALSQAARFTLHSDAAVKGCVV